MPRPRPWTDDELREAVRSCCTLNEVCRRLGIAAGGQTYESLRRHMSRLGLQLRQDSPDTAAARSGRPWTDDQLWQAVRQSRSLKEVSLRLGLTAGARGYENLRRHMSRLGIDGSHLPHTETPTRSARSWSEDELRDVVRDSHSVSEVLRRLGYAPSGGMHRYITGRIRVHGLDTSHFTGQSWSRGCSFPQGQRARPLEEILVKDSTYGSGKLRVRLIAAGLKQARCETCGLSTWRDQRLTLQLDHINGDPTDNRLVNLRILCPNCHSQTDTWCRSATRAPRGVGPEGLEPSLDAT